MADVAKIKYVWPSNWQGSTPEQPGLLRVGLLLTFTATTTAGVTDAIILRPADWRLPGVPVCLPCKRFGIETVCASVNKIDYVEIKWQRNPAERALVLPTGWTEHCFADVGGLWDDTDAIDDNTGDLLLSAVGVVAGGSYSIGLAVLLKE